MDHDEDNKGAQDSAEVAWPDKLLQIVEVRDLEARDGNAPFVVLRKGGVAGVRMSNANASCRGELGELRMGMEGIQ